MFGAKYSRMKFWVLIIPTVILSSLGVGLLDSVGSGSGSGSAEGAELVVLFIVLIVALAPMHIMANRIRDFGSSPWLVLWSIVPLVGLFQMLYYGCRKSKHVS